MKHCLVFDILDKIPIHILVLKCVKFKLTARFFRNFPNFLSCLRQDSIHLAENILSVHTFK